MVFTSLVKFVHSYGEQWSQGVLWPKLTRFALDPNKIFSGWSLDWFEKAVGPMLPPPLEGSKPLLVLGRLGCSLEGTGKRRVFAIGNYINQRLLRPLHEWLAQVLKRIPMDGTFWQTRPLDRLTGSKVVYSSNFLE